LTASDKIEEEMQIQDLGVSKADTLDITQIMTTCELELDIRLPWNIWSVKTLTILINHIGDMMSFNPPPPLELSLTVGQLVDMLMMASKPTPMSLDWWPRSMKDVKMAVV